MKNGTPGGPASAVGISKAGGGGIGGRRDRTVWFSPDPSPEVVAELSRCFPKVVTFPEDEVSAEVRCWAAAGVVAKCFGRRFPPDALVREFRWRGKFKGDITAFGLDRGYYLVKFSLPEEREKVLGTPWVVNGQVVAVEPWRPAFVPLDEAITHAIVWIRLPQLPVEYWGEAAIRRLVSEAGVFVGLDECTAARNRMGFARASVKIDLRQPLRPGTLMLAGEDHLWQRFAYENLDDLCLRCGVLHPAGAQCKGAAAVDRAAGGVEASGAGSAGPRLGPWVLAVRRRLPAGGDGEGSSSLPSAPATVRGSTTGEGWMRPSRVARRPPPAHPSPAPSVGGRGSVRGKLGAGEAANPFSSLAMEGREGREDGSLGPPGLSKRARPNEVKGSQSPVQAASSTKLGPGRGQARSRKLVPIQLKGKEVASGLDQSTPEVGRGTDDSGVFLFTALDRGRPGISECPNPSSGDCQLSAAQVADPMLVSVQAVPGQAGCGVSQSGDRSAEVVVGSLDASPGSAVLGHDMAVSRLRQAIQGDGEGPSEGRVTAVVSGDEDLMSGDEDAVQIPHSVSS